MYDAPSTGTTTAVTAAVTTAVTVATVSIAAVSVAIVSVATVSVAAVSQLPWLSPPSNCRRRNFHHRPYRPRVQPVVFPHFTATDTAA